MIPQADIVDWRAIAPWSSPDQVEHDLVLAHAICELYSNPVIAKRLVFRGGTAIRDCLDHWLGKPSWKQNQGRFTFNYRFTTELEPVVNRKVKIEINTREHSAIQPHANKIFQVSSPWFQGKTTVLTYSIEELLATKLRALYQRKKGRDLYDFWYAIQYIANLDIQQIIFIFNHYMEDEKIHVSRAEFEKNLSLKQRSPIFNSDIRPLLSANQIKQYRVQEAYEILFRDFLPKLSGNPWKELEA